MRFAHPTLLFALLALPLLAGWMAWVDAMRQRRLARYAEKALWPSVVGTVDFRAKRAQAALRLTAMALAIFAVARPQWGIKERPIVRQGSDIILLLDVSNSMLAADLPPTRLENAKRQIKSLIHGLRGDRIGVVLFAGESFVLCPLTTDYRLAAGLLDGAHVDSVSIQGTRIGNAIDTARQAFDRSALGAKSIILVTDGEDHESAPREAARRAARDGIVIECVGIGSTEGVPILLPSGKYKEDRQGRKVTSRLDAELLRDIAMETGGRAVVVDHSGDMALDSLYASIKNYEKRQIESVEATLREERYQWPLGAALLLLALELFLGLGARRANARNESLVSRLRAKVGRAAGTTACVLFLALSTTRIEANPLEFGNRAARLCEEGNKALEEGNYDEAIALYEDAKFSAPDNPILDFNIGAALARKGEFQKAAESLAKAARNSLNDPKLLSKSKYNTAHAKFQEALRLVEQAAQSTQETGSSLDMKKIDAAIRAIGESIDKNREVLDLDPEFKEARENLASSLQALRQLAQLKEMAQQHNQGSDQSDQDNNDENEQNDQENDQQNEQPDSSEESRERTENSQDDDRQSEQEDSPEMQEDEEQSEESSEFQEDEETQEEEEKETNESESQSAEDREGEEHEGPIPGEQQPFEGMTREDALRLLSTLPPEDLQELQEALRPKSGSVRLEKEW